MAYAHFHGHPLPRRCLNLPPTSDHRFSRLAELNRCMPHRPVGVGACAAKSSVPHTTSTPRRGAPLLPAALRCRNTMMRSRATCCAHVPPYSNREIQPCKQHGGRRGGRRREGERSMFPFSGHFSFEIAVLLRLWRSHGRSRAGTWVLHGNSGEYSIH